MHYRKSLSEMPRDWPSDETAIDVQMSIKCSSSRQKGRLLENMLKPAQLVGDEDAPSLLHFLGIIILMLFVFFCLFENRGYKQEAYALMIKHVRIRKR